MTIEEIDARLIDLAQEIEEYEQELEFAGLLRDLYYLHDEGFIEIEHECCYPVMEATCLPL